MSPLNAYVSEKRSPTSVGGAFVPHDMRVSVTTGAGWAAACAVGQKRAATRLATPGAKAGRRRAATVRRERVMQASRPEKKTRAINRSKRTSRYAGQPARNALSPTGLGCISRLRVLERVLEERRLIEHERFGRTMRVPAPRRAQHLGPGRPRRSSAKRFAPRGAPPSTRRRHRAGTDHA